MALHERARFSDATGVRGPWTRKDAEGFGHADPASERMDEHDEDCPVFYVEI